MKRLLPLILLGVFSAAASEDRPVPPPPSTEKKSAEPQGWERYKILAQRNMFSKDRGKPRESVRTETKRDTPPPPRIEADLVLIGVVQKDGVPAAIIENRASGKIVTVKAGETIGAGKAKAISLDSVDFENDGILHVIKIGSTLAGGPPKAPAAASSTTTTTTTTAEAQPGSTALPAPATGTAPASGGDSVLERMRRKRQEELRK